MSWLSRMLTLPSAYNSLSDVTRNPLGALGSAVTTAGTLGSLASSLGLGGSLGALLQQVGARYDQLAPLWSAVSAGQALTRGQGDIRRLMGLTEEQVRAMTAAQREQAEQANRVLSILLGLAMARTLPSGRSAATAAMHRVLASGSNQLAALARMGAPAGMLAAAKMQLYANAVAQAEAQRQAEVAQALQMRQMQMQSLLGALSTASPQSVMAGYSNAANAYAQLANVMAQQYNLPALLQGIPEMMKAWGRQTPPARKNTSSPPANSMGLRLPTSTSYRDTVAAGLPLAALSLK